MQKRRLQGSSIVAFQYLKVSCKKNKSKLFSRACSNRTKGDGFELKEGRFKLDIRNEFFMMRVMKLQNRFPREVVGALSLETFKVRLDGALSNLVLLKMSLFIAGEMGYLTFKGPLQPILFYDSMISHYCSSNLAHLFFWQTFYIDSMVLHINVFLQGRIVKVHINIHNRNVNVFRITTARNH